MGRSFSEVIGGKAHDTRSLESSLYMHDILLSKRK